MSAMELPLVVFTLLSQLAIGLVLVGAVRQFAGDGPAGTGAPGLRREWLLAAGLLAAGLVASLFHLGHPGGAPRAITHLATAWLSREVLVLGLLLAAILAAALTGLGRGLVGLCAALGLGALLVQGMTYAPPSFPALHNGLPFVFFAVTAVTLGAGAAAWLAPDSRQGLIAGILTVGLAVGLVVFLVVPCVWLSGGTVMRETAQAYLASPLYWTHVVLGLALPLALVLKAGRIPALAPVLMLVGAVCGRIVFYLDTVHTAANLGGLY